MKRSWGWAFLRLTRPVFLAGGALAYAVGAAAAHAQGASISWGTYLLGQALVTSVQLAAQYANEYFDAAGDRVAGRTWFSGGSGVLPSRLLPRSTALGAAFAASVAALVLVGAVTAIRPALGLLGLAALGGAWAYSAPPVRLVSSGFGETVASLIVGGLVPLAGLWVNGGRADSGFGFMVAALVAAHFAMIVALSIPDAAADRAAGKRTLAVRLGPRKVRVVHTAALTVAATVIVAATVNGSISSGIVTATALGAGPAATVQAVAVRRGAPAYALLTGSAVATFAVLAAVLAVGTGLV